MKGKSILESKAIEEIWPSIPEKFRARWEHLYKMFSSARKDYKKARKRINGLRKHATINSEFLKRYEAEKEVLIGIKRIFDRRRKQLNKLSLSLFTNVPVEQCKKEVKSPVQEKKVLEPFTVILSPEQLSTLAQAIEHCLDNWPKSANRVALQFDEKVSYKTFEASQPAEEPKKTFVTSKKETKC